MTTTERIFALLAERGITAYRAAKDTGISSGNFSDWKSGKASPSYGAVVKLAEYLGICADYLRGLTDDPQAPAAPPLDTVAFHWNGDTPMTADEKKQVAEFIEYLRARRR